jgi:hypothetical protein
MPAVATGVPSARDREFLELSLPALFDMRGIGPYSFSFALQRKKEHDLF